MSSAPGTHCKNRVLEWAMTAALLGMAVLLMIWPNAMVWSGALMLFYLTVGWCRAVALYLNGGWPTWGARVRAFAAIGTSLVWLQMAMSSILSHAAIGAPPSPSVPLYLVLFAAELYSTYRAAADARFR